MAKIISLFNHKGGVSKTTTVFHLGWKLAELGKKVLVVDADPQCNLTGLTLGLEDSEDLFSFYRDKQNTDIYNSLAPVFGDSYYSAQTANIAPTPNPNMFILAGNIRFSELDMQIATAITSGNSLPVLRPLIGAFDALMKKITSEHRIDYVLVDMSPSVSATNQIILMSSDYFIIPISPDFYCYQAVDSLSHVLPQWADKFEELRRNIPTLPQNTPKMLGFISQNYRVYTTEQNSRDNEQRTMSKSYQNWLDKIKILANMSLVPALQGKNMVVSADLFKKCVNYDSPYHLAGIQNFNSLIPISQEKLKPIFKLEKADGNWGGAVWSQLDKNDKEIGVEANIREADRVFTALAQSVDKLAQGDRA